MFLRGTKVVTPEMEKGMLKMVIHCLYPCLILDKTLGNDLVRNFDVLAWGVGLGFGLVILGMAVAYLMGLGLGLKPGNGRRTFCVAVGTQNYGYIAIPLLGALFVAMNGNEQVYGVLFIHSLGVEIALWMVGVMIMTGSVFGNPKLLINGPTVSVVLGVLLSSTGGWQFLEESGGGIVGAGVRQMISWLGVCAFPMGLVLIGAMMYDLIGKEQISKKVATGSLLVRIVIMPIVFSSGGQMVASDSRAKAGAFSAGVNAGCGRPDHCGASLWWESRSGSAGCYRNFDCSPRDNAFMDFLGNSFCF